jgi:hypothetical protein
VSGTGLLKQVESAGDETVVTRVQSSRPGLADTLEPQLP